LSGDGNHLAIALQLRRQRTAIPGSVAKDRDVVLADVLVYHELEIKSPRRAWRLIPVP
jgi:hypothetical protein